MAYVTPERFRTMGLGVDLTTFDDVELRSILERASAAVDAYCNVSHLPQHHDFRGGSITDEVHEWQIDAFERQVVPFRFWPWHQPVLAVDQFRIYSTPTVYTEIDTDEIFINNSAGFIEISSLKLTQYGIFGSGVITALIGLWHPVAKVSYSYGYSYSVSDEVLEPTDGQLFRAQNQWWQAAPTIKKNGVTQTTGFTVDLDEGTVTFTTSPSATDVVTASYVYTLPWQIAHATALTAADDIGESGLRGKGMTGVDSLSVGEITIRRAFMPQRLGASVIPQAVPLRAQAFLAPFVQVTVR